MRLTNSRKIAGELAARNFSPAAKKAYFGNDYAVYREDDLYTITDGNGNILADHLTFDQADGFFAADVRIARFYTISPDQFLRTEYRPLDAEYQELPCWYGNSIADEIHDMGEGYTANLVQTTSDGLKVWHVYETYSLDDPEDGEYYVELPEEA